MVMLAKRQEFCPNLGRLTTEDERVAEGGRKINSNADYLCPGVGCIPTSTYRRKFEFKAAAAKSQA